MKSRVLAWSLLLTLASPLTAVEQYEVALPDYRYEFPRDHFNHPGYQTEWWYYTGNLAAEDGRRFGFELTYFRQGVSRDPGEKRIWDIRDLYLAHLALSDLNGKAFYHAERTNRAGPGIAGVEESQGRIWNGNWRVTWSGADQHLDAVEERFSFSLALHPEKPPVIHGEHGISQKADGSGHASHYISLTRLITSGTVQLDGKTYIVSGTAWMDHEFFTHQLDKDQVGWDWFSLQLNDDTELMLYRIRRRDGSLDPHSSGTYIDVRGRAWHLDRGDFSLLPGEESWKSPVTQAVYPLQWRITLPKLGMELEVTTQLRSQELSGQSKLVPSYWEGTIDLKGHQGNSGLTGTGYLEMTGYDRAIALPQ